MILMSPFRHTTKHLNNVEHKKNSCKNQQLVALKRHHFALYAATPFFPLLCLVFRHLLGHHHIDSSGKTTDIDYRSRQSKWEISNCRAVG